jgi:hypothetical protein
MFDDRVSKTGCQQANHYKNMGVYKCVCVYIYTYTDMIYRYTYTYTYFIHIYICCDMYHLPFASWFTQIYGVCFVAFMCWKRNINPFQHLDLWKGLVVTPKARPWKFLFTLLKTIEPWNFEGWLENREYSSSLVIMKSHEITILIPWLIKKTWRIFVDHLSLHMQIPC